MAALPRSEISFRRSGSSGLVWDDKLLSGELKPSGKPKDEEGGTEPRSEPEPKPYKTVEVEPTFDPPSPKLSGCVCSIFGKPNSSATKNKKKGGQGQTQPQKKHQKSGGAVKRKS